MEVSSGHGTELPSEQPTTEAEAQQSCCNLNTALLAFPLDDSTSTIAEANIDVQTNTLSVTLRNWNAVFVGHLNTEQFDRTSHLHKARDKQHAQHKCFYEALQADSGPKEEYCSKQQKTTIQEEECQLLPFNEVEACKQALSDETVVGIERQLPLIKIQGYLNGPQCEQILEQLDGLQGDGQFEKHDRLATSYLNRFACRNNNDMALALKIERGVAFSYQKEFKQSKHLLTSVIKFDSLSKLRNPNILLARAYCRLVQDYRYRKSTKLSALFHVIEKSETLLQNHESPEDWSEVYYNYGSLWLAYMSMIPDDERNAQARDDARRKARHYFEMTIESGKKDPRLRVQIHKQIYGHLRLATLLLDCSSTVARIRKKVIPPQDIEDAEKHLNILEHQLSRYINRGTYAQVLKTRSDQYYRQGMYQLAKETAQNAFRIARCHGFNTELDSLQERIDFLDQLCEGTVYKQRITLFVDSDSETSGHDAGCEGSGSETEKK